MGDATSVVVANKRQPALAFAGDSISAVRHASSLGPLVKTAEVSAVVHPVVEHAHDEDARLVALEDVAGTAGHCVSRQCLKRFPEGVHIRDGLVTPPCPAGVPADRRQVCPSDVGEVESLHRLANSASISSSVSSWITRPAATSS